MDAAFGGWLYLLLSCSDVKLDEKRLAGLGMLRFKLPLHKYRGKGGASVRIDWADDNPALYHWNQTDS
jgi:hypothetical protein